ncbi:lysoplasmalogenase [Clostridium gasigenes]|uniref:Lysoplasmalogenase n=1 Tax=Clostridium gasigenes TaxID=94869 RepID=A0A7X0SCH4_9CLOT|nr:lysoplasmalogenase [Clostridium gasigenes]MBB6714955.1 lysoplasmalogenase [Clostridium gasigenes]
MIPFVMFFLMIISLTMLIIFNLNPNEVYKKIFKTSTSFLFIGTCIASAYPWQEKSEYFILILIALIFSMLGDVFLVFHNSKDINTRNMFILGLLSFSVAHVFYTLGFIALVPLKVMDLIIFVILLIIAIIFLTKIKKFNFENLFPFVIVYGIILSAMLTKSISIISIANSNPLGTILLITGTVLFFISDALLCFYLFYDDCKPYISNINLIFYYVGQGLIALSFISGF